MSHPDLDLWQHCQGEQHIIPIAGRLFRLVESQEQIATRQYVDSLEEQALLEAMLEQFKPNYPEVKPDTDPASTLHYLLKSPFRYPPLKWGSRFGRTHEPSIFYGGSSVTVTLAESAYYRLVFWHSMLAPPPKPVICTQHTLFAVDYQAKRGVQLHQPPFQLHEQVLTHPTHYTSCQLLGTHMRQAQVDAFQYVSARAKQREICIGLLHTRCFVQQAPIDKQHWLCDLTAHGVTFKTTTQPDLYHYPLHDFLINGLFPLPA